MRDARNLDLFPQPANDDAPGAKPLPADVDPWHLLDVGTIVGAELEIPDGLRVFCGPLLGFRALGPRASLAGVVCSRGRTLVSITFDAGPSFFKTKGVADPTDPAEGTAPHG